MSNQLDEQNECAKECLQSLTQAVDHLDHNTMANISSKIAELRASVDKYLQSTSIAQDADMVASLPSTPNVC